MPKIISSFYEYECEYVYSDMIDVMLISVCVWKD